MYSELIYHQTIYTAVLISCWNYSNTLSDTQSISWPEITSSATKCRSSGCTATGGQTEMLQKPQRQSSDLKIGEEKKKKEKEKKKHFTCSSEHAESRIPKKPMWALDPTSGRRGPDALQLGPSPPFGHSCSKFWSHLGLLAPQPRDTAVPSPCPLPFSAWKSLALSFSFFLLFFFLTWNFICRVWEGDCKIKFQAGRTSLRKANRTEEDYCPQNLFSAYFYKIINAFFFFFRTDSNPIWLSFLCYLQITQTIDALTPFLGKRSFEGGS